MGQRRMVTHKHASDELSQQTVTDSRFARPNHQSCFGKWWLATPNREPFAVWGSKPPKLLRPVVAWHGRPRSFGGLGCQTVAIWWSGRKTVFFGGLPTQTTTDHIDCGGLQWQTTKVHWLLHQTTKTQYAVRGLATQTTNDHLDCGCLLWQTTTIHSLLHQTTKT